MASTDCAAPIDHLPMAEALQVMLAAQIAAVTSLEAALPQIAKAAGHVAKALHGGHKLAYIAAGSSGLMALSDACELPGTFGISTAQIVIAMAGGVPMNGHMPGDTEDDASTGADAANTLQPGDVALILSASGTTPYALAALHAAKARGAHVIAIANRPDTPLLASADTPICLTTGPEVIAGSTRLGAGTAQKITLNMISTMAGVQLGHVHDGLMVNVHADNAKLRDRATEIVMQIAAVPQDRAAGALAQAAFDVKAATLIAAGASAAQAISLLATHDHRLGPCLRAIATPTI